MKRKRVALDGRLKERRFWKNEGKSVDIYMRKHEDLTVGKIARKTGLSRSTVYAHHHAIREIIPDYENYILSEYSRIIRKKMRKKDVQLKSLYLDMLVFILRNQKIFEMFLEFNDREIMIRMISKLENKIIDFARLPKEPGKILRVYMSEVVEIIFEWGNKKFSDEVLFKVLSDIMYLTETCGERLLPLNYKS